MCIQCYVILYVIIIYLLFMEDNKHYLNSFTTHYRVVEYFEVITDITMHVVTKKGFSKNSSELIENHISLLLILVSKSLANDSMDVSKGLIMMIFSNINCLLHVNCVTVIDRVNVAQSVYNSLETGSTLVCGWISQPEYHYACHTRIMYSRFPSNSEVFCFKITIKSCVKYIGHGQIIILKGVKLRNQRKYYLGYLKLCHCEEVYEQCVVHNLNMISISLCM